MTVASQMPPKKNNFKAGFLKNTGKDELEKRTGKNDSSHDNWDDNLLDTMVLVLEKTLDHKTRVDLDRRLRMGTGAKAARYNCNHDNPEEDSPACGHSSCSASVCTVKGDDAVSKYVAKHTSKIMLKEIIPRVMESTSEIFYRIKDRGEKDGLKMDDESAKQTREDVLKETLVRELIKAINADNRSTQENLSREAGLLATPQGYTAGDLNSLEHQCVSDLMTKGVGVMENFLGDEKLDKKIFEELELFEFDSHFQPVTQQEIVGLRKDRICWKTVTDLDREKHRGMHKLMHKLMSLPFELNKKCNLFLQANGNFQLGHYSAQETFYKKHLDGGYKEHDLGRKITCIYYPNVKESERDLKNETTYGKLRVYKRRKNIFDLGDKYKRSLPAEDEKKDEIETDITPGSGRLVLMRSRDMPHEVLVNKKKRFAVSFYIPGPAGPGDAPEGMYTKR